MAAVALAGPFAVLVATFAMPFVWAVPIGIVTSELSCAIPCNGGAVVWVRSAFGPVVGFVNGYLNVAANIVDLPVYPRLAADYVNLYLMKSRGLHLSWGVRMITSGGIVVASAVFNLLGLEVVDFVSGVLAIGVTAPFIVTLVVVIAKGEFSLEPSGEGPPDDVHWGSFAALMLWAWLGFDAAGSVAGEVKDPGRTYPRGIATAALINAVMYAIPVCLGAIIVKQPAAWDSLTFVHVGDEVGAWMGVLVVVAAVLSNAGIFQSSLAAASRALWALGGSVPEEIPVPIVPRVFGRSTERNGTPYVGILAQTATSLVLINFEFSSLVAVDVWFSAAGLLLEISAFVWMRMSQPDRERPFRAPGGTRSAFAWALPGFATAVMTMALAEKATWAIGMGVIVATTVAYYVRRWYGLRHGWDLDEGDHTETGRQASELSPLKRRRPTSSDYRRYNVDDPDYRDERIHSYDKLRSGPAPSI